MAAIKKLKIAIKTGSEAFSGTNANIYLVLSTQAGGTVYQIPTRPHDMETGKLDVYEAVLPAGPDLDDLRSIVLVNGMNGPQPGWRVLWVKIDAQDADGRTWQIADAMLERWLDTKDGVAPAAPIPLLTPRVDLGTDDVIGPPCCELEIVG
jgi:hypothetical protein